MTSSLAIRLASPKDAETIALESMAEIEHNLHWSWTPERVREAIGDRGTNVAVATLDASVIAFGIMVYEDDVAHLQLFAVREDMRRRGIGSDLLKWLETVARVAGLERIEVEARLENRPARAFYRKHRYSEIETVPGMYQHAVDGVRLEKILMDSRG